MKDKYYKGYYKNVFIQERLSISKAETYFGFLNPAPLILKNYHTSISLPTLERAKRLIDKMLKEANLEVKDLTKNEELDKIRFN